MNLVLSNSEIWDSVTEGEVDNNPSGKTSQQGWRWHHKVVRTRLIHELRQKSELNKYEVPYERKNYSKYLNLKTGTNFFPETYIRRYEVP